MTTTKSTDTAEYSNADRLSVYEAAMEFITTHTPAEWATEAARPARSPGCGCWPPTATAT